MNLIFLFEKTKEFRLFGLLFKSAPHKNVLLCHGGQSTMKSSKKPTDGFIGKNLKGCDNFQIPQLKSFKITNYSKSVFPDGWQGVYIEILFNNRSRWSTYVLLCIIWLLDYVIYHKLRKEQLLCKLRKFTK